MRRATALWEMFVTRFEDALDRHKKGRLTAEEAGELLGISARHFRRMRSRYEVDGVDGLRDRRLGRVSGRRRANWSACVGFTERSMPTSPQSTSMRSCASGTTTRWATR